MSVGINLGLAVGSIALLLGIMAAVRALGRSFEIGSETQRKLIHVATGLFAIALPFVFHERWPLAILLGLSLVVMVLLRSSHRAVVGLGTTLHGVKRDSYGEIYLVLAVGFLAFRVEEDLVLYVLPLLVLTLADAAAALVGVSYGRRKLKVEDGAKSVEGTVAFFTTTWLIAMIVLLLMTDATRLSVVLLSLMIAAFGAIVEVNSWKGLDNLFIPIGLHLFLVSHMDSPPIQLVVLAAGFLVTVALILLIAPRVKVSPHAAKAATVLIFLVCSVTAPHNAILPVAAILAHLAASRNRPCRSRHPDLDLLGVVAGVSLLWLFVGEQFGVTAINMFNFTFAVGAAALLALAGRSWPIWLTVPLIAAVAATFLIVAQWNPAPAQWHGSLWLWMVVAMGAALVLASAVPTLFDRYRSPRVFAIALAAPLLLYMTQGIPR